jgi:aryl-alcohol dehydrogenase-like predicted oxidoreductase
MDYSLLGPTGVKVSKICLGTATFGVAPDAQDAGRVVHAALDLGINFFDTANVYGASPTFDRPGVPPAAEREPAEQILGRALAGRRDEVLIATKSGERRFDPAAGLSRRYIIQQVEHSLRRLGTDYIDLYYAHFPDPHTPLEQTLSVYDDLVRQGKLRYVALSNHPAWQVTHALWIADDRRLAAAPVCVQVKYNLIDRAAEHELAPPVCSSDCPSCRSDRCTADSWPAPGFSTGESTAISASAGPGSPRQSSRSAVPPSG